MACSFISLFGSFSVFLLLFSNTFAQDLGGLLATFSAITDAATGVASIAAYKAYLDNVVVGATPSTINDALVAIGLAANQSSNDPIAYAGLLKNLGVFSTLDPIGEQVSGCGQPCTSQNVGNPKAPSSVYEVADGDAPWSVNEEDLIAALYIPPDFTFGKNKPLIMVPGTGNYGKQSFSANMGKKFEGSGIADPVYLNVPEYLLGDIQKSGEYLAYAIKYISAVSGNSKVAAMTWSQGALVGAWALQYWPSTRELTDDVVNLGGDYNGSAVLNFLCSAPICEDSLLQQKDDADFIATLRSGGGSSAYVPTTSVMSLSDNFVPQLGGKEASGYIEDERNVGVSNVWIQEACFGQPGGGVYTHESMLLSNLAYDLAVDALTHEGPGEISRLNLGETCSHVVTQGLSDLDIFHTELTIPISLYNVFTHVPVSVEPQIESYAR